MIDKTTIPGVWIMPNGREICRERTPEGNAEYIRRKRLMAQRQNGICCFYGLLACCPGRLSGLITFDHEQGRGFGGGKRDDRIEVDGLWQNGAAHLRCNNEAGSRRFHYNLSLQARANHAERKSA